jgi:hypothetical protein
MAIGLNSNSKPDHAMILAYALYDVLVAHHVIRPTTA